MRYCGTGLPLQPVTRHPARLFLVGLPVVQTPRMAPGRTMNSQLLKKNDASILTPRNPGHPDRLLDPLYLPHVRKREYNCEQGPPGSFQGSTGCFLQALQNPLNRPDTGQGLLSRTFPVSPGIPHYSGSCEPAFPAVFSGHYPSYYTSGQPILR